MKELIKKGIWALKLDRLYLMLRPAIEAYFSKVYFAGVLVNRVSTFDFAVREEDRPYSFFPLRSKPDYESGIANAFKSVLRAGDRVTIIGGGAGVTTIIAAKQVSENGVVTSYEAGENRIAQARRTLKLNSDLILSPIKLIHGLVGEEVHVYTDLNGAKVINPKDLQDCDVLEMDCEGSEKDILRNMTIRPRVIIVETHGLYDSSTAEVEEILTEIDYEIVNKEVADAGLIQRCEDADIYVLTALDKLKSSGKSN